ncbi:MAG: glycosyltransferase [bacterium]|nr:glycosyltransferase [bacterium]
MKRILLVSYYYPPYPFGGALRLKQLFNRLKKENQDVKLLTAGGKDYFDKNERIIFVKDNFDRNIPSNARNILRSLNPLPDSMLSWSLKASEIIEREHSNLDLILITAPPFSLPALLSLKHSKDYLSKIILDIRDMLYEGALRDYRFFYPKISDRLLENIIFSKFSRFTTNVQNHVEVLKKRHSSQVKLVMNSFDDYSPDRVELKHPAFVYTGKIDSVRYNRCFFEAFEAFTLSNDAHLYVAGEDRMNLMKRHISERIEYLGQVPRENAENLIFSSDVCIMMNDYSLKDKESVFSYKITDYIKYKKPILYAGPETAASKFIQEKKIGIAVVESDKTVIADALKKILSYAPADVTYLFKSGFDGIV